MPFCRECGERIDDSAKFCPHCGTPANESSNHCANKKEEYAGKIFRCPNCGQELKSFEVNCPSCGYELRGTKATTSVQELAQRIQQIEAGREHEKKPIILTTSNYYHLSKADRQIISVIQSYPIPNTIEDILEMLIVASSNIDVSSYNSLEYRSYATKQISEAWKAKCEQAYQKAKMSFKNTTQFYEIEKIHIRIEKEIKKQKRKAPELIIGLFGFSISIIIITILIVSLHNQTNPNYDIDKRNSHLEQVEEKIEEDIADGKFEDARNKAYTLVFDEELSAEKSEYWDNKRKRILSRIDEADAASRK